MESEGPFPRRMVGVDPHASGYDCGINGANTTNCHFVLFSTKERTSEWERGKRVAKKLLATTLVTEKE